MIKAREIRSGNILKIKNDIYRVIKSTYFEQNESSSVMKIKFENIITGQIMDDVLSTTEEMEDLEAVKREMQYLYSSGDTYTFLDNQSYEQLEVEQNMIGDNVVFLQEDMNVTVQYFEGRVVSIELPTVVIADIDFTDDVEKGNVLGSIIKDAKLANGHEIKVPAFVKQGEKVRIDTRTGEYISRA